MSILLAFLVFSLVVVVHELGHFYAARKAGILVEEFAIGMGPKLLSVKPGETVYSLRLFPIGGACMMLGDDPMEGETRDERAYNNKPVWKRMIVILAGVFMNFVLALVICVPFVMFNGFIEPSVYYVADDTPAQNAGLMRGDRLLRADGKKIKSYDDFYFFMNIYADGSPISLDILRDGGKITLSVTPYFQGESYKLGFIPNVKAGAFMKLEGSDSIERAGVLECVTVGYYQVFGYVKSTIVGIAQLFTRQIDTAEMYGPIGIVSVIGESYEQTMSSDVENKVSAAFWMLMQFAAVISANLAVMNLLPIPVMDGGRMVFLIIEAIRKKPMNPEREGMIQLASFVLLMVLAVLVAYNDIMKLI